MNTVLHPVGPEGSGTYWRRRLVLVLLLAALVAAALLVLTRTGEAGATATQAAFTPVGTAATPAGPVTPTASPTASPAEETPAPAAPGPCRPGDLDVSVTTDAVTYGPDAKPRFTLRVENISTTPCTVEVGSSVERFEVSTAAGERIWGARDCAVRTSAQRKELQPGSSSASPVIWQGTRSAPGCPTGQGRAGVGEYTVVAALGEMVTGSRSFAIR